MAAATESTTTDPCVESSTVSCDPCGDASTALIEQPAATEQQPIESSKQAGDATHSNGVTPLSVLEKKIIRQVEVCGEDVVWSVGVTVFVVCCSVLLW